MTLFQIQLLSSFFIGGSLISILSFLAEKASNKMAGLIIALPSAVAISYLFISLALGPKQMISVVIVTPISMGFTLMFTVIYLYLSKIKLRKIYSIFLSFFGAMTCWLAFAFTIPLFKFNNLLLSVLIYLIFCLIAFCFLTYSHKEDKPIKKVTYTLWQKIFRGVFSGSIIALTVFLSKTAGPAWGGIFSAFPAVFSSSLLILHYHHDSDYLFRIFKNTPIGFMSSLFFIITSYYAFPAFGSFGGLIVSYIPAVLTFSAISLVQKN